MNDVKQKLIFGLSPKATLINSFVLAILSEILWSLFAAKQLKLDLSIDVPWYVNMPLIFLSIFMFMRWIDFKFDLVSDKKVAFRFRIICMLIIFLVTFIIKILLGYE
jgi:hypothetical protein